MVDYLAAVSSEFDLSIEETATLAAGVVAHLFPYEKGEITPDYPYDWLRDRLNEFHRAKIYFTGDFYPLLPQRDSFTNWCAYQFNRPDMGFGIVEVFRKCKKTIELYRNYVQMEFSVGAGNN